MRNDPIVAEVYRVRQEILTRFNGDLDAYSRYIQGIEAENRTRGVFYREIPPRALRTGPDADVPVR